jgi:hypothetical protein
LNVPAASALAGVRTIAVAAAVDTSGALEARADSETATIEDANLLRMMRGTLQ